MRDDFFEHVFTEACEAGSAALKEATPTPMVVVQHANQLNDTSPIEKTWNVPDGVCGFAWINVSPATQPFVRWLKKQIAKYPENSREAHNYGSKDSYYGGWTIWVSEGGQSMERKIAYAHAFGDVLNKNGIKNYVNSRMD